LGHYSAVCGNGQKNKVYNVPLFLTTKINKMCQETEGGV